MKQKVAAWLSGGTPSQYIKEKENPINTLTHRDLYCVLSEQLAGRVTCYHGNGSTTFLNEPQ
jgi:hypothetical protein